MMSWLSKPKTVSPYNGGTPDSQIDRPAKSHGSGIMVSDFIMEGQGYLRLMDEEYERAKHKDFNIWKAACELLEYRESRDGYWNSDKFMKYMEKAVEVAEAKFPKGEGYWSQFMSCCICSR